MGLVSQCINLSCLNGIHLSNKTLLDWGCAGWNIFHELSFLFFRDSSRSFFILICCTSRFSLRITPKDCTILQQPTLSNTILELFEFRSENASINDGLIWAVNFFVQALIKSSVPLLPLLQNRFKIYLFHFARKVLE